MGAFFLDFPPAYRATICLSVGDMMKALVKREAAVLAVVAAIIFVVFAANWLTGPVDTQGDPHAVLTR
jgi:hypothetical protein